MNPRFAIIGPHRRRTGTGPFIAELLRKLGCTVEFWERAEAYRLLDGARPRPQLDAIAICSPAESHLDYLSAAIGKGIHVFCEKPIVWPSDRACGAFPKLLQELRKTLDNAFRSRLVVHENTQWIYTLQQFRRMAGEMPPEHVRQFRCELSPSAGTPAEMIMECAAHANSLLLELGCRGVEDPWASFDPGGAGRYATLDIGFLCRNQAGGPVRAEYRFAQQLRQPRPAAYEVNRRRVERRVDMSGYQLYLRHGIQEEPMVDPLRSSVEDFLNKLAGKTPYFDAAPGILANSEMSYELLTVCSTMLEAPHA